MVTTGETTLRIEIAGVGADVTVPSTLLTDVRQRVTGLGGPVTGRGVVDYRVTVEGPDRFGLERDQGGLRRDVTAEGALRALVTDLGEVVHRRRPDVVLARGGAVAVDGRGVVIVGSAGTGTTQLVDALVAAGATLLSDGLVAIERVGVVHPVMVTGGDIGDEADDDGDGAAAAAPVAMIVSTGFEAGADWDPTEVTGVRSVLGLLDHVLPNHQATGAAREMVRRLAAHTVEWRGPRPDVSTVAGDVLARARALPRIASPPPTPSSTSADDQPVTRARYLRFDDLLPADEHRMLLDHALSREDRLLPSAVLTAEDVDDPVELRRSLTTSELDDVWPIFDERLRHLLPHIRRELDIDWFGLGHIERQLTVSGDGDHFTLHVDNAGPDVAGRLVSAIYYFNRMPARFSGGELRLFDTVDQGGTVQPVGSFTEIIPADNTLVVFPSDTFHEVRPVHVPGNAYADRRFTIVFWACRPPTPEELFAGGRDQDECADRQRDLLPDVTPDAFRVVPTPPAVHDRLARAFADGSTTARREASDLSILPSGTPGIIELGDLGEEAADELQHVHEEWAGVPIEPTAAYGLRVYGEGQTLARHVDRVATHVVSSVVHVAADIDEPWPLVVEDRQGVAHEVVLEPGQMLLYEGARLPHSRPQPLHGRHYASLFLHYRPLDWTRTLGRICREADPARDVPGPDPGSAGCC